MILTSKSIYLIIGNVTRLNDFPLNEPNSKIYLLNIRNYTWVDRFEHKNIPESTSPTSPTITNVVVVRDDNQLNTMKIVIGVMGGVVAVIIITGVICYKWYQRSMQNRIIRIPATR